MQKILMTMILTITLLIVSGCGEELEEPQGEEYQKIRLVMTVNGTDTAIDTMVARKISELVAEETKGNVEIQVFANDQIAGGNATKGILMIADGTVDLAAYAAGTMSLLEPKLFVASIPWAFTSYQEARRVIDTTGGEYYAKLLAQNGLVYLGSTHNGLRQLTNNKRPVKTLKDIEGLRIRVPGGQIYIEFIKQMGAIPLVLSLSEIAMAIEQGIIDGQENGFSVTNSRDVQNLQKYMTIWNYTYENYLFVANNTIFDKLEPKTQELLRRKTKEACDWGRDLLEQNEQNLREKFIANGMQITELSEEELKPFKKQAQPMIDRLKAEYGEEACKAFNIP